MNDQSRPHTGDKTLAFAVPWLRRRRGTLALLVVVLLVGTALQLIPGLLMRSYIDVVSGGASVPRAATAVVIAFLVVSLVVQVLTVAEGYVAERLAWSVTNDLRAEIAAHCLRLDLPFHSNHLPGELVERIDGDTTVLSNFVSRFIAAVLSQALLVLGLITALFLIDWRIGLTLVPLGVAAYAVLRGLSARGRRAYDRFRESLASFTGFAGERLAAVADIAGNGAVPYTLRTTRAKLTKVKQDEIAEGMWGSIYLWSAASFFTWTGVAVSLLWSWQLFQAGEMTLGTAFLVFIYSQQMAGPLDNLTLQNQDYQAAAASVARLRSLLDVPLLKSDSVARPFPAKPPRLELDAVTFEYRPGVPALSEISLDLPSGASLGVVGRTGCGKTTLARLIARLYDPTSGVIQLDGTDLRDIDRVELRRWLAVVPQEVQLYSATLRDNLTFFADDGQIRDDKLIEVLSRAGLGEWLDRLPLGLDTVLLTDEHGLSAGEEQLVAFSRVLLRSPYLVVLDEATSRLDPSTEQMVQRVTATLLQGRTSIVIAHRLSTLNTVDSVLMLDGGRVVEFGRRTDLAADSTSRFSALLRAADHAGSDVVDIAVPAAMRSRNDF